MKKLLILLICSIFLLCASTIERNTLSTFGEGVFETAPDTVIINLGIQREGFTAEEAQSSLRRGLAGVLEALQPLGIPDENIQTAGYSLYPVYKQRRDDRGGNQETEEIDRYRTYIRLSIEVYQIPQVGKIADTAIKAGANRVENISFTLRDNEAAKNEALKLAVNNAQQKAGLLADRFNVALLTPIRIEEQIGFRTPQFRNTSFMMAEAADAGFSLPEGKVIVNSQVSVVYEIAPLPPRPAVVVEQPTTPAE